jgi:hypothetical protein
MPAIARLATTMAIGATRRSRMPTEAGWLAADRRRADRRRWSRIVERIRPPAVEVGRARRGRQAPAHAMACAGERRGRIRIRSSSPGVPTPRSRRCEGSPSGADASRRSSRRSISASRPDRRRIARATLDMIDMLEVLEVLEVLGMARPRRRRVVVVAVAVDIAWHRPSPASIPAARPAS